MIMQKQSDGSYEQIGFIKSKAGESIDKIVDANGDVYFTQGFTREVGGIPPLTLPNAISKPLVDYSIYGNSIQDGTPSPENPVEVQSVGDRTDNLFNENDVTYGYWITDTGSISSLVASVGYDRKISVIAGKAICARAYGEKPFNIAIGYYDADNAFILRVNSMTGSIVSAPPANAAYGVVYIASGNISSTNPITPEKLASYKIVLSYGESTEYEPYGYRIPVVVRSKNLFDKNDATVLGYINSSGNVQSGGSGWYTTQNFIKCSGIISLHAENGLGNGAYIACYNSAKVLIGTVRQSNNNSASVTVQLVSGTKYIKTCCRDNNLDNYQLEFGDTATEYETYHEPVTTNIYLDEPLRKIGDYYDAIDFNSQTVIRNIKKIAFDGSEQWIKNQYYSGDYYLNYRNFAKENSTLICSHVPYTPFTALTIGHCTIGKYLNIWILDKTSTLADWEKYLNQQYNAGTPITVHVVMVSPTIESITLPQLPTFSGTTIVSTGTEVEPSDMEIAYKGTKP